MDNSSRNIELEKLIDDYIKGNLTEEEAQELWAELLKNPSYIKLLETEVDVTRYHQQNTNQTSGFKKYWRWFSAAAAVILVIVGLNIFSSEDLNDYTIEHIKLQKYLATANVMRSGDHDYEMVDSLLNFGFENAVNSNIEKALTIYKKVISKYPHTVYATKAHLNIGILTYNSGNYGESITNFKKVISFINQNGFIKEQAYWYMANAYLNMEEVSKAKKALERTQQLNGAHKRDVKLLLDRLNEKLKQ